MSGTAGVNMKTIFVVDDDQDYCEVTQLRLEGAGYRVVIAHNGEEALELLNGSFRPDLIIMDTCMPVKDGVSALINLNAQGSRKNRDPKGRIPVLVVTGLASERLEEIVKQLDANDFLQKPFDAEQLITKVRNIIGK